MSEPTRRVQTNTDWTISDGFVVLPTDGTILKATREQASISFFIEHIVPEIKENKTKPAKITREVRLEMRMPYSALMGLYIQIAEATKTLSDDKAGVVYLAPNAAEGIASSVTNTYGLDRTTSS